jgi:hypothetical protein
MFFVLQIKIFKKSKKILQIFWFLIFGFAD